MSPTFAVIGDSNCSITFVCHIALVQVGILVWVNSDIPRHRESRTETGMSEDLICCYLTMGESRLYFPVSTIERLQYRIYSSGPCDRRSSLPSAHIAWQVCRISELSSASRVVVDQYTREVEKVPSRIIPDFPPRRLRR